jgi:ATP-dependent protease ClpP protease subunit
MKRIEIRGVIVPSAYDCAWLAPYIAKGMFTPESAIRDALAKAGDDVELYVSSQGGSVFAGNEIINALKQFKASGRKLDITVGALAASMAANIVALAGPVADHVRAHANSKFMFHGAQTITEGGSGAHQDSKTLLDSINADVVVALKKKSPKCSTDFAGWFAEGRMEWLSADQAKQLGLIDEVIDGSDSPLVAIDQEAAKRMLADGLDVAALNFKEPAQQTTVSKAEWDSLMARFTGLQSAKDKEIAEKDKTISAITSERNEFKAKLETAQLDLGQAKADLKQAKADLSVEKTAHEKTKTELGTANTALSAEKTDHSKTKTALAAAEENHLRLVGGALGGAPEGKAEKGLTGLARMNAADAQAREQK